MKIEIILGIMLFHWIFDFILQSDKQAKGKSKNMSDLLNHTMTYSVMWIFPLMLYSIFYPIWIEYVFSFIGITFIAHTITDYYTSRLNAKLWAKGDHHNFFVSIGFDQYLHYLQLFLTFKYLF